MLRPVQDCSAGVGLEGSVERILLRRLDNAATVSAGSSEGYRTLLAAVAGGVETGKPGVHVGHERIASIVRHLVFTGDDVDPPIATAMHENYSFVVGVVDVGHDGVDLRVARKRVGHLGAVGLEEADCGGLVESQTKDSSHMYTSYIGVELPISELSIGLPACHFSQALNAPY